jgi:hypothetical protein
MADKIFIGKVFTDRWENPELNLTAEDLDKLKKHLNGGKVKVVVKKSQKGTWYAEINTFQPTQQAPF